MDEARLTGALIFVLGTILGIFLGMKYQKVRMEKFLFLTVKRGGSDKEIMISIGPFRTLADRASYCEKAKATESTDLIFGVYVAEWFNEKGSLKPEVPFKEVLNFSSRTLIKSEWQ